MLTPSIFNTNLVDSFFTNPFDGIFDHMRHTPYDYARTNGTMNTDIQVLGENYQMEVELPGYAKEDIKADLKDGYLTIFAEHQKETEEKDKKDKFVRRERYYGSCRRSFYVGTNLTREDIKASFENGVLKLLIPKNNAPAVEEKKYIAIE